MLIDYAWERLIPQMPRAKTLFSAEYYEDLEKYLKQRIEQSVADILEVTPEIVSSAD